VTDVSLLSSKASETSDQEVSYATAKIEVRLVDGSTGNLLRTFIGRSPIFGTKETGEYNRSKAVLRAIEFSLDEVFDGFLRQLDLLDWSTTLAKMKEKNSISMQVKAQDCELETSSRSLSQGRRSFIPQPRSPSDGPPGN